MKFTLRYFLVETIDFMEFILLNETCKMEIGTFEYFDFYAWPEPKNLSYALIYIFQTHSQYFKMNKHNYTRMKLINVEKAYAKH